MSDKIRELESNLLDAGREIERYRCNARRNKVQYEKFIEKMLSIFRCDYSEDNETVILDCIQKTAAELEATRTELEIQAVMFEKMLNTNILGICPWKECGDIDCIQKGRQPFDDAACRKHCLQYFREQAEKEAAVMAAAREAMKGVEK